MLNLRDVLKHSPVFVLMAGEHAHTVLVKYVILPELGGNAFYF